MNAVQALNTLLREYGLSVSSYAEGPTITEYRVQLNPFSDVGKLRKLRDNICIALNAKSVTVNHEGQYLIIEAPNNSRRVVRFSQLCNTTYMKRPGVQMMLGIGSDGKPTYTDLVKCKHMLIAGQTGSGKSVFVHNLIVSMLIHNPDVFLYLIDPKMTEFMRYDGLPTVDVTTSSEAAISLLESLVDLMEERYATLSKARYRDIESYTAAGNKMRRIVCIIDEFADIAGLGGREFQRLVGRLAQKARACGIHLILATQKPTTKVIDTIIKANMPTRVCLKVSSNTDSRVILDRNGGKELLGNGDMLLLKDGMFEPIRLQGMYMSEKELDDVIRLCAERLNKCNVKKIAPVQKKAANKNKCPWTNDDLTQMFINWKNDFAKKGMHI